MKKILTACFLFISLFTFGQNYQSLDTIQAPASYENIYNCPVYSDSLASSFVIFIKKEVKAHKHVMHSEHVYVLDGEGEMMVGDASASLSTSKKFTVKKGDIIFIPKGSVHSLTVVKSPMKVLSIQSPMFDGKDRVMIEQK